MPTHSSNKAQRLEKLCVRVARAVGNSIRGLGTIEVFTIVLVFPPWCRCGPSSKARGLRFFSGRRDRALSLRGKCTDVRSGRREERWQSASVYCRQKIAFHLGSLPRTPEYPSSQQYHARGPVPAGNLRHILIGPTGRKLTDGEVEAINGARTQLYVYGFAKFADDFTVFGAREIGFCVVYNPVDPTHSPGQGSNDRDNPAYVYSR